MSRVVALVLAAGCGRRFGTDKRQARMEDQRSLLQATLDVARAAFDEVWVVLRVDDPATLAPDCRIVRCSDAASGMGHSLAAGVKAVQNASSSDALAVMLGDMPWVSSQSLCLLQAQADAFSILLPEFQGQRGHPVIFGRDFWPMLACCHGDKGARDLLRQKSSACRVLALDDPGVLLDVDYPADLHSQL